MSRRAGALGVVAVTLLVATPCAAQEGVAHDAPPRSYVDIDVTLLNAGVSAAGHVGSRMYLGAGGSFFPALSANTFGFYPIEIMEGHGFARWAPMSSFQVDAGLRAAWFQDFRICVFGSCPETYGTLVGPYADVHFGFRHFKVGPRAAYVVRTDTGEWGAMLYPLVLRIQITP